MNEFIQRFGPHWSETEVEAAVWKLAEDAATEGRLLVDLTVVELSRSTPLVLLAPDLPPILPDPLPSSLEEHVEAERSSDLLSVHIEEDTTLEHQGIIPGPTFDASVLEKAEDQARFHRNVAAVTAVLAGKKQSSVAEEYQMASSTLSYLVKRTKELGQIACVPHGSYHRERVLRPEFQQLIRKLYTNPMRPTVMAVYEDVRLKRLAEELSEREAVLVLTPTYRQVWKFLKAIAHDKSVKEARSGLKHPPREVM